jgi:hypothetical protein
MAKQFIFGCMCFFFFGAQAQDPKVSKMDIYSSFKASFSFTFSHGAFLGIGYGLAARGKTFQPAINLSINGRFGKNNLGNRDRKNNRMQINSILSPLLTTRVGKKNGYFEEINPGYFGNVGAVNSNYLNALTLGTSFVTGPKGIGKNIETTRNRSQQLIYTQIKVGWVYHKDKPNVDYGSFQFNMYEDYLFTNKPPLQYLADNFDRFFTGGGNVQLRLNKNHIVKVYHEIYTGANYRNTFDFPDWVDSLNVNQKTNKLGNPSKVRKARYPYQDFGQQMFNRGRTFFMYAYEKNDQPTNNSQFQVMVGRQRDKSMFSQNWIHTHINVINKPLPEYNSDSTVVSRKKHREKLHFFYPSQVQKCKFIFGIGTQSQTYQR